MTMTGLERSFTFLERRAAEITPVELEKIERAWRHHAVVPAPAQKLERSEPA